MDVRGARVHHAPLTPMDFRTTDTARHPPQQHFVILDIRVDCEWRLPRKNCWIGIFNFRHRNFFRLVGNAFRLLHRVQLDAQGFCLLPTPGTTWLTKVNDQLTTNYTHWFAIKWKSNRLWFPFSFWAMAMMLQQQNKQQSASNHFVINQLTS